MSSLLKKLFTRKSEQQRMYDYLCQATDQVHLEWLQREWDRKSYNEKSNWL